MGKLYDLIQEHVDAQTYPPSERQLAKELGVSQTTLANWRTPKKLIAKEHLESIARVTRNPYGRVLEALLEDIGYRDPGSASRGRWGA
jgi:transcriptional regulator with XRE-family HTH domain